MGRLGGIVTFAFSSTKRDTSQKFYVLMPSVACPAWSFNSTSKRTVQSAGLGIVSLMFSSAA